MLFRSKPKGFDQLIDRFCAWIGKVHKYCLHLVINRARSVSTIHITINYLIVGGIITDLGKTGYCSAFEEGKPDLQ